MKKRLKSTLLGLLCASTALSALPPEALAGPMSVASPETVGLNAPITDVHYYRRYWGHRHWGWHRHRYYRWGYYRPYRWGYYRPWGYYRSAYYPYYGGYDPAGAIFASAALGLMGAGIAAATAPRWGWGWGPGWGGWGGWGWGGGWW
ncbi:MAG: hypothetical protein EKK29_11635 [Hyphomicrobiales bacterium]|nr:MAG: hypothetical protein EKK29_11635 [Hyphomicrobiales bacterium]